jgi:hypothetical protein
MKFTTTTTATVAATLALVAFGASACDTGTSDYKHASGKGGNHAKADSKPKPKGTTSQEAALQSAQQYLAMGSGFSRAGLTGQLSSKAGDGFPHADAVWAVNHTDADWNAQAVLSAKAYKSMGGFSKSGLTQQLTSSAGDQYTPAQAAFAVKKVGY